MLLINGTLIVEERDAVETVNTKGMVVRLRDKIVDLVFAT